MTSSSAPEHAVAAGATAPAVRMLGLTKRFGSVVALDGVDLTVDRGLLFGFLGPNGAGKTTAMRILVDLIRPTAGRCEVLGFDAQRQPLRARERVGYLPSEPGLPGNLTGRELFDATAALRPRPVDAAYRDRLIERLQLDPTRHIHTLSRGNRQKVGLVYALMHRPELLILDEPTNGLDPLMQEEVLDLLRETVAEGATVFFSSHTLAEVEEVCDHVAMLHAGRVLDVISLAERRGMAARRFVVTFDAPPPDDAFDGLPGVRVVARAGAEAQLEVRGGVGGVGGVDSIDALVKRLARFTVRALESSEPTLEEIFLAYYDVHPHHHDRANTIEARETNEASGARGA